jgi:hypothetical protein
MVQSPRRDKTLVMMPNCVVPAGIDAGQEPTKATISRKTIFGIRCMKHHDTGRFEHPRTLVQEALGVRQMLDDTNGIQAIEHTISKR